MTQSFIIPQYSRIQHHIIVGSASMTFSVPTNEDFTIANWSPSDLVDGEIGVNRDAYRAFLRINDQIKEICLDCGTPSGGGPQGPQGPTGLNGLDGATGPTGLNGLDGATGATGLNGLDGATGATGLNGLDGVTGPQGPTGSGGSVEIDFQEIAFGTGTGLTSSAAFIFDDNANNVILGTKNYVSSGAYSTIIGGSYNYISGKSSDSSVISSNNTIINYSNNSSVISSEAGIYYSSGSSIISASGTIKSFSSYNSNNNVILSSGKAAIYNVSKGNQDRNSIISSENSTITNQGCRNSIISSLYSNIYNAKGFGNSNMILSSKSSSICNSYGYGNSNIILSSRNSLIREGGQHNSINSSDCSDSYADKYSSHISNEYVCSKNLCSSIIGSSNDVNVYNQKFSTFLSNECSVFCNKGQSNVRGVFIGNQVLNGINGNCDILIAASYNNAASQTCCTNANKNVAMIANQSGFTINYSQRAIIGASNNSQIFASCGSVILGATNSVINKSSNVVIAGGSGISANGEKNVLISNQFKMTNSATASDTSKLLYLDTDDYIRWNNSGVSGTFSAGAQIVTVTNGIITSII
jgi:hypothetical protein